MRLGKDEKQIAVYWNDGAWEKYKLCRENLVKHTGGGDGDDDWFLEGSIPDSDADAEDLDPSSDDSDGTTSRPRKLKFVRENTTGKHSRNTLVKFLNSEIYTIIHNRCVSSVSSSGICRPCSTDQVWATVLRETPA